MELLIYAVARAVVTKPEINLFKDQIFDLTIRITRWDNSPEEVSFFNGDPEQFRNEEFIGKYRLFMDEFVIMTIPEQDEEEKLYVEKKI